MVANNVIEMYRAPVALPDAIKNLKCWLLWKLEQHPGESKPRKVPYYISGKRRSGTQGSPADLEELVTYDRVCLACEKGGYSGIGMALLPQWGITAGDFDNAFVDGVIKQGVVALIADTYSEISPSGTGVRAFWLGSVPANRKDNSGDPQVEFFTSKGFVTVTGIPTDICALMGNEDTVAPLSPAVLALYTDRFGQSNASRAAVEDVDPRQVREMLDILDPDCPHDTWFRTGLGLHHQFGADGFELWNAWSAKGKKYPGERTLRTRWRSIRNDDANPVTIASVRQAARDAGWIEDMSAEFQPVVVEAPQASPAPEKPWPAMVRDKQGRIEATVNNLLVALARPDICGWQIARDTFRDEIMLAPPGTTSQWRPLTDDDYTAFRATLEKGACGFKPIGRELVRDAVSLAAKGCQFDSGIAWLEGLVWDGVKRIDAFAPSYLNTADSPYTRAASAYLWTALAGRVLEPGCQADMVPILVGPQGAGKSRAVAALVPSQDHFVEIDLNDDPTELSRIMRGRLVGELSELRGLNTRDLEHIKSFITRQHEKWTPKYRELPITYPRRIVIIGTTNQDEFLADETGNRRWLPLKVGSIDVCAIERDRLQLWAEAAKRFSLDGVAWADAERLGRDAHEQHMVTDPWEPHIETWVNELAEFGMESRKSEGFKMSDVLFFALGINAKDQDMAKKHRAGRVLRKLGLSDKQTTLRGARGKYWSIAA